MTVELFREDSYCGGTHVVRTAEISPIGIEKKGRQNRRVALPFAA